MKASAGQVRAALGRPDGAVRLFLLHGPDTAGADELAATLARAMGAGAERIDLDAATLKGDAARLADEAAALSLFGGARFIRATGIGDESVAAVEALLAAERAGNPVVALAPAAKSTSRLVKLAIAHPLAMAHACYPPSAQDAERLAGEIAREHGLRLGPGTARRIVEAAGGDRAVMSREIEKLALYLDAAPDRPADLDHEALDAVGADLSEADLSGVADRMLAGDPAGLGAELAALAQGNVSGVAWLRATMRRLVMLAEVRAAIDAGETPAAAVKRQRVHFSEEDAVLRATRRWTPAMLATALDRVRAAERAVIAPANAGDVLAAAAVTNIARGVARRG